MADIPFDAIVSLLTVLIGVPALVVQSIASEVRHVMMKRWKRLLLETGGPVVLAIVVVACGIARQTMWGLDSGPIAFISGNVALLPPGDWTWTIVIGLLLIIATYTALRIPHRYGRRNVIIQNIEKEAARPLRKTGRLAEDSLEDLIELGRQSEPGQDTELVLRSLYRLANKVCCNTLYKGDSLESLIQSLVDILASNSQPGTPQNFRTAVEILHRIVNMAGVRAAELRRVDVLWALHELSALGQAVLTHVGPKEIEHTLMQCVQALGVVANRYPETATEVSQALFEVGVMALEKRQMLCAIAGLEKLLTLGEANQPVRDELAADILGLIAHFWTAGHTAHKYVKIRLDQIDNFLANSLIDTLTGAREHSIKTMQFQTADHLNTMIQELRGSLRGSLLKKSSSYIFTPVSAA